MIARFWRSITLTEKAGQYLEYLNTVLVPACQRVDGYEGLFILKEDRDELTYFLLLSFWDSNETLGKFADTATEAINFTPEGKSLLVAYESSAGHYEVLLRDGPQHGGISPGDSISQGKEMIA